MRKMQLFLVSVLFLGLLSVTSLAAQQPQPETLWLGPIEANIVKNQKQKLEIRITFKVINHDTSSSLFLQTKWTYPVYKKEGIYTRPVLLEQKEGEIDNFLVMNVWGDFAKSQIKMVFYLLEKNDNDEVIARSNSRELDIDLGKLDITLRR